MTLEGKVSHIIYRNEQNGYTVFVLNTEDDRFTAVGETENIHEGDKVEVEGEMSFHKNYGEQIVFKTITKLMPVDNDSIVKYIEGAKIKGLGEKTAERIVDRFGSETIEKIRYEQDKLMQVKGMTAEKITSLHKYIEDQWERWNLTNFLAKYGISIIMASKIYDTLGITAIEIIKEDPYNLLNFIDNIEFKMVDKLGENLNIDKTNENRVKAGIIYTLTHIMGNGHTCIDRYTLIEQSSKMLEVDKSAIENGLLVLDMQSKIVIEKREDDQYIYRRSIYMAEKNISNIILQKTKLEGSKHEYESQIEKVSQRQSLVLSDKQKEAIKLCLNSNVAVITGGPGTGKTTIIKCVIDIFKERDISYVLCAPTGRAAKRITETSGEKACTMHRLLEITKIDDRDLDSLINFETKIVENDVVIVDEASMIDTILMNNLIKALKPATKLILVGDSDQLPSVGPGSVLKDIISSGVVNVLELTEIYRQSAKSEIIVNAHRVKNGEYIDFKKKDKKPDMFLVETGSIEETRIELESLIAHRLENYNGIDILNDVQVITPIKKTALGTWELNKVIQNILNPISKNKAHRKHGDKTFMKGDKVMQIRNNYDLTYEINGVLANGVYNGDIGIIEKIDSEEQLLVVKFDDGKVVEYEFKELDQLEHAYAITVHKSQGSEFNTVIIPIYICFEKLFNRNLIYTAMTRAKSLLIFVGSKQALNYMVDNTYENKRCTGLKLRLIEGV